MEENSEYVHLVTHHQRRYRISPEARYGRAAGWHAVNFHPGRHNKRQKRPPLNRHPISTAESASPWGHGGFYGEALWDLHANSDGCRLGHISIRNSWLPRLSHRIGWWENLQEIPIFDGKNHGFPVDFPLNQSIDCPKEMPRGIPRCFFEADPRRWRLQSCNACRGIWKKPRRTWSHGSHGDQIGIGWFRMMIWWEYDGTMTFILRRDVLPGSKGETCAVQSECQGLGRCWNLINWTRTLADLVNILTPKNLLQPPGTRHWSNRT